MTRQIAVGLGLTGIILFSTKAIFAKLAYQYGADAISLLLLRMVFSLPFYLFFALYRNQEKITASKNDYLWVLLFGFLGYYLASYFDFKGLEYIKASLERLILFTYPTFVILLSFIFFKIKISSYQLFAILITYLGICIVFLPEIEISDPSITLKGSLLVLLSAVTYASYIFGSGWLIPKFGARRFTSYVMIVSSVLIIFQFMVESKMSTNVLIFPKEVYIWLTHCSFFYRNSLFFDIIRHQRTGGQSILNFCQYRTHFYCLTGLFIFRRKTILSPNNW